MPATPTPNTHRTPRRSRPDLPDQAPPSGPSAPKNLLTVAELAERVEVDPFALRRLVAHGHLTGYRRRGTKRPLYLDPSEFAAKREALYAERLLRSGYGDFAGGKVIEL